MKPAISTAFTDKHVEQHLQDARDRKPALSIVAAVEFFGASRPLNMIKTQEIDHWVFHLEQRRLSNASINHRLAALSRMMTVAMDRGGLDAKPKMPRRRRFQTRLRIVSVKEEITLLRHMRQMGFDDQADAVEVGNYPVEVPSLILCAGLDNTERSHARPC